MKYYRYNIDLLKLNILCVLLFIPLFGFILYLDLYKAMDVNFFLCYFFWMILHEFLHGLGFYCDKSVDRKNIVYGINLEKGIMYCMCKQKISKKTIFISLLFPFFLIGVLTFILGFLVSNKLLMLLSLFNVVGSLGDLLMFFSFLKLPSFWYIDSDLCDSFTLCSDHDLSLYKMSYFPLVSIDGSFPVIFDYKKISVTKLSFAILALVFIILLIKILSFFI